MKCNFRNVILFPISLIYSSITFLRNQFYDLGMLKSKQSTIPLINVGNLAAGGTGKTPHVELIISILKDKYQLAMLSRGYKRMTKGFVLADKDSNCSKTGDEPYQVYRKFPECIVAVDEKRIRAIEKLSKIAPNIQAVVLDDAFQHRQISAGLSILLTCFDNLYVDDSHLPGGNLRENKHGAKRAHTIIVTKCPPEMKYSEMNFIESKLKPAKYQNLFFSTIEYGEIEPVFPEFCKHKITLSHINEEKTGILLVTGIAAPMPLLEKLKENTDTVDYLFFADHHFFQKKDILNIQRKFEKISTKEKIIIVTEKDAVRLADNIYITDKLKSQIYFIPVKVKILNNKEKEFIKTLTDYVTENSRNS